MQNVRVLFVLKKRTAYGETVPVSSGLRNSISFMVTMMRAMGHGAVSAEVRDGNDIDRKLHYHKPTHCIIEAFWVTPEKMRELRRLHPSIKFVVRNHSKVPFLAGEGMAFGWICKYMKDGLEVMSNSQEATQAISMIRKSLVREGEDTRSLGKATYGPNWYPVADANHGILTAHPRHEGKARIGCFGAIRPLKNHIQQAIGAIQFAERFGKKLEFHINSSRTEQGGGPILKNLRELFAAVPVHTLVEHDWMDHEEFLGTLRRMDIAMQVSLSETYNIVSADAVAMGVPVLLSEEIPWALKGINTADPNSAAKISYALGGVWNAHTQELLQKQQDALITYNRRSEAEWSDWFQHNGCD